MILNTSAVLESFMIPVELNQKKISLHPFPTDNCATLSPLVSMNQRSDYNWQGR